MVFLPELLYRWEFSGRSLFRGGEADPPGPALKPRFKDWPEAVWHDHYADLPPHWLPGPLRPPFRMLAGMPGLPIFPSTCSDAWGRCNGSRRPGTGPGGRA